MNQRIPNPPATSAPIRHRRIGPIAAVLLSTMLASCGSGGGEATAVAAAAVTTPEGSVSAMQPDPASEASTSTGLDNASTVGPSVRAFAVAQALRATTKQLAVPADGKYDVSSGFDSAFSSVSAHLDSGYSPNVLVHRSSLTLPTDTISASFGEYRALTLIVNMSTDGHADIAFLGTGSIGKAVANEIRSGPFSLPNPVPLDKTLHQFDLPSAPGKSIRFFVGAIAGKPDWMRVCWEFDVPDVSRVSCTWHTKADGEIVGAEVTSNLAAEPEQAAKPIHAHVSTLSDSFEPSVLQCTYTDTPNADQPDLKYRYAVAAFDAAKPDGGLFGTRGTAIDFDWHTAVSVLGTGVVEYSARIGLKEWSHRRARVESNRVIGLHRTDVYYYPRFQMDCS